MALNPLISKSRKPRFDLTLQIFDLNNIPLVTGTCAIKYHLPSSIPTSASDTSGRTPKEPITSHVVPFTCIKTIPLRLTIDKNNNLQDCPLTFSVEQEFHNKEKNILGTLVLNLAEYVEECELGGLGEEGVVRRYLMQDSKINSTLRVGIGMKQVDGERNFVAPPLKSAAVFGGIAGIMGMAERGVEDDLTDVPIISKSRDYSELQDIYRRALAASWSATPGELSADQCIEDIFSGGTGWKNGPPNQTQNQNQFPDQYRYDSTPRIHQQDHSDEEQHHTHRKHHRTHSGTSVRSQNTLMKKSSLQSLKTRGHKYSGSQETTANGLGIANGIGMSVGAGGGGLGNGGGGFGNSGAFTYNSSPIMRQMDGNGSDAASLRSLGMGLEVSGMRKEKKVDEFEVRDDLVAWRLPSMKVQGDESDAKV